MRVSLWKEVRNPAVLEIGGGKLPSPGAPRGFELAYERMIGQH